MKKRPRERGAAEFLATVLLSGILVVFLCGNFMATTGMIRVVKREILSGTARIRMQALTEMVIRDVDRHRFPLLPVVHPVGKIILNNGQPHQLSERVDLIAPAENSSPLSYFEVKSALPLRVQSIFRVERERILARACAYGPGGLLYSAVDTYLSIFSDNAAVLSVESLEEETGSQCALLSLHEVPSPVLPVSLTSPLELTRTLIPVQRTYTLYVDKSGTLRIVTHHGVGWAAPQPIAFGIDELHFDTFHARPYGMYSLQGRFLKRQATPRIYSRLSREPVFNLLLNREE